MGSGARAGGLLVPLGFAWRWANMFIGSSCPVFNSSLDKRLEVF